MRLTCHKVAKFFGTRTIFKGIDCTVAAGHITLLVGANGAGKSTLLRIMAGLAEPSAGTVHCDVPPEQVRYVGHATFLYDALTAWENLAFWRDALGLKGGDALLEHTLRRVELLAHAHNRAGVFSRGMAQRLNLARALLGTPQLILLDEPATGLDVHSAALLRREIQAAAARGAGVVWISHDVAGDVPLAHHVLALENGRLAYNGAAQDFTGLASLRERSPHGAGAVEADTASAAANGNTAIAADGSTDTAVRGSTGSAPAATPHDAATATEAQA